VAKQVSLRAWYLKVAAEENKVQAELFIFIHENLMIKYYKYLFNS
jgi:hypothetical protein